jgi:hypothetical protein
MSRYQTIDDGAYLGVVVALSHGVTPGPASAMRYRININLPGGPQVLDGIAPAIERWPDEVHVNALKPGTAVWIAAIGGHLQLMARELPATITCGGQSQ